MFKGKTAIVTGSSSGIGTGIALAFAKQGANVILTGRNEQKLEEVKKQCISNGLTEKQVVYVRGDMTDDNVQKSVVETAVKNFKAIDILVNNAGINKLAKLEETKLEDYDLVFNTNLRATTALTLLAVPHLKNSKGNIVNISSVAALRPLPFRLFYCMSKASLDMMTKWLAFDLAPHGVRVNSVNPGGVPSNILRDEPKEMKYDTTQLHPIKRLGTAEEIAETVLFLSSDKASFITGAVLPADGGLSLGGVFLK